MFLLGLIINSPLGWGPAWLSLAAVVLVEITGTLEVIFVNICWNDNKAMQTSMGTQ